VPNGTRLVRDSVLRADEFRETLQCPQLSGVSLFLGTPEDGFRECGFLLRRESRFPSLRLCRERSFLPTTLPVSRGWYGNAKLLRDEVRCLVLVE